MGCEKPVTKPLLFDIETRSRVDLPKQGGLIYSEDPSTEILCAAWYDPETATGGLWIPGLAKSPPAAAVRAVLEGVPCYFGKKVPDALRKYCAGYHWVAHNAWGFDELVWSRIYPGAVPSGGFLDTMPYACACGLPGRLEAIGRTLRNKGKHGDGKSRLKKFMDYKHEPKPADLLLIGAYCWDDTSGLLKVLWEHIEKKRKSGVFVEEDVIEADRLINRRGVRCDTKLASEILRIGALSQIRLLEKIKTLTDGQFETLEQLRKTADVHKWLKAQGVKLGELNRDYITRWLQEHAGAEDEDLPETETTIASDFDEETAPVARPPAPAVPQKVIDFLSYRGQALKITAHKASAVLNSSHNGRLHHILQYGAAHTLRWGGRRFQPQNLARPHEHVDVWRILDRYAVSGELALEEIDQMLAELDLPEDQKPTLEDACGSLIRSLLVPDEGEIFAPFDYNAIEFRCAGWMAQEASILQCFAEGRDPYIEMAARIYGVPVPSIDKKTPEGKTKRAVGKVVNLGCIYQLGEERFDGYAKGQKIDLAAAGTTASTCINMFRDWCPRLAGEDTGTVWQGRKIRKGGFWRGINDAAILGVRDGFAKYKCVWFQMRDGDLHMVLPSGRPLVYRKARVDMVATPWGKQVLSVLYQSPRGFENNLHGGKLTENADQAICRDLLAASLVRCLRAGIKVVLHVHDEIVPSVRTEEEGELVGKLMATKPEWAKDFPMAVEGEFMDRYAKSARKGSRVIEIKS